MSAVGARADASVEGSGKYRERQVFTPRVAADLQETSGQSVFASGPVPLGTPPALNIEFIGLLDAA